MRTGRLLLDHFATSSTLGVMFRLTWIFAAAVLLPRVVLADWRDQALTPRAMAMGQTLRAAATGANAIALNPAGVALSKTYVLEGTIRFSTRTTYTASVCDSMTTWVAACLYYDHLPQADASAQHAAGLVLAVPLVAERLFLGVNNRYLSRGDEKRYALDAGLILKPVSFLNLGVSSYHLVGHNAPEFPRGVGAGVALFPVPQLTMSADAEWNLDQHTRRFGGGIEYFLGDEANGFPLRLGYWQDEATGRSHLTAGMGYIMPQIAFDVALRKGLERDASWMLIAGLRLFLQN